MTLYPNLAALYLAGLVRTGLAASELHLYETLAGPLSTATRLADITEANYDGYAFAAIANFNNAYLDPSGGASIQSGTVQFDYGPVGTPPVGNSVLGFYLLNSAGDLVVIGSFDAAVAMNAIGDSIPINVTLNFGR